jgi:uncharacterized protein (TIRG00374 family)
MMPFLKKHKKIILVLLGLIIFALIIALNKEISFASFSKLNYYYLLLSFIFYYLGNSLAAMRWGWIIKNTTGEHLPYRKYNFYFSMSSLLGSLGFQEVSIFGTQAGALLLEKINFKKIFNIYLIDKFFNTVNLILISLIAVPYFFNLISLSAAVILAIIFILVGYIVFSSPKLNFTILIFYLNKFFGKLIKFFPISKNQQTKIEEDKKIIFPTKLTKKIYLLSFLKLILFAVATFFVFKTFNLNIGFFPVILAFPITQLIVFFAITPGGIGILEAGWFAILKLINFNPVDINTFVIGLRVVSSAAIILIALINYLFFLTLKSGMLKYEK